MSSDDADKPADRPPAKKTAAKKSVPKKKRTSRKKTPKKRSTRKKSSKSIKKTTDTSGAPWTFPKNSLEDALLVARAIEDKNAGNPMKALVLVKAVGFNRPNDWRFLDLLKSANQYGLVSGSGASATVRLGRVDIHRMVVSSEARQRKPR